MAADLIVAPLDPGIEEHVLRVCTRIGLMGWPDTGSAKVTRSVATFAQPPKVEDGVISALNAASLDAFNLYAAGLEGFSGPSAMTKTGFRNLPWWLQSIWLPIEFDPPRNLASDEGDPTFVGSSVRLLDELAKIKTMSSIDVAELPPLYLEMRNDYRGWSSPFLQLSEDETVRWVWNALRDGAQSSIGRKLPMLLAS